MKNDEVAEIFDEVDVDLMIIQERLAASVVEWVETGRVFGLIEVYCKTPLEYLKYTRDRIGLTREFFEDWRKDKKL